MFLPSDRRRVTVLTLIWVAVFIVDVVLSFVIPDGRIGFFIGMAAFAYSVVWCILLFRAFTYANAAKRATPPAE